MKDEVEKLLSMVWNDGACLAGGAYNNAPHYGLVEAMPKLLALIAKAQVEAVRAARIEAYQDVGSKAGRPKVIRNYAKEMALRLQANLKEDGETE